MPPRSRAVNPALLKDCAIFSEGPRDRRVYFVDELQDAAGNPRALAGGYRPTKRNARIGNVYQSLPANDPLNDVWCQVWEHSATADARLAAKQARGR